MASKINTETKRKKLDIRHAPYWEKVTKGRSIGFRKGTKQAAWMGRVDIGGKFKYTTFDYSENWSYEDALTKVTDWFSRMIGTSVETHDLTVKGVIDHYEQKMCILKTPIYAKANAQRVRKHLSENFSKTKVSKITHTQVELFRDNIVSKTKDAEKIRSSKVSANRVLNTLKAALNLAYKNKIIGSNDAWLNVESFKNVGAARQLFLTDAQVSQFLAASKNQFHNLAKACVLTGNRVGSLTNAIVKDFDSENGTIRLESKKGNGVLKSWECYLSDDAVSFFSEISKNAQPNAPLLPNDLGDHWGKNGYRRELLLIKQKSKMPDDFDLYAFRHYHISKALKAGLQAIIVAKNCGTSIRMIEKHYAKFLGQDRRSMMNTVQLGAL